MLDFFLLDTSNLKARKVDIYKLLDFRNGQIDCRRLLYRNTCVVNGIIKASEVLGYVPP